MTRMHRCTMCNCLTVRKYCAACDYEQRPDPRRDAVNVQAEECPCGFASNVEQLVARHRCYSSTSHAGRRE